MDITREEIARLEAKYTEELKEQLIGLGHTIDPSTTLPTMNMASSMEHESSDVAFAIPLYRLLDRLRASQPKTIINHFGVFFDPSSARRYNKAAAYAWISYVHYVPDNKSEE
jgi:hypothetical protein